MTKLKYLALAFLATGVAIGCDTDDALLKVRDGAAGSPSGTGGSLAGGTSGTGDARGGAGGLAGTGGGGSLGAGGLTTVGSGGVSTGGVTAGRSGTGGTSVGGTWGGNGKRDGGADVAVDALGPAPDAALDAGQCPSGQVWCPGCTPGAGSCGTVCPAAPCPMDASVGMDGDAGSCSQLTSQAACEARSDCHAVFNDPGTCGCASSGCCARFSRCADGGKANCTPPTTFACAMPTPFCESPYVLAYTAGCYEGCVLSSECGAGSDGGSDAGGLGSCSSPPRCAANEIPIRVHDPDLGQVQCACAPNPCGSSFPTCDCGASICSAYGGAQCVDYMPDSGYLVCTLPG